MQEDDKVLEYKIPGGSEKSALEALASVGITKEQKYIILHPETPAHGGQRQWPRERYAELGEKIGGNSGYRILLSGTAREQAENRDLSDIIGDSAVVLPPVPINVFASVLSRAALGLYAGIPVLCTWHAL